MEKCNHDNWYWVRGDAHATSPDDPLAIRKVCARCDESIALGPSNDEPEWVDRDILTAGTIAILENNQDGRSPGRDVWEWSHANGGSYLVDFSEHSDTRDWSWDHTRPVAGQYEEHLERTCRVDYGEEDALRDPLVTKRNAELIAEQARHDVAASVARHADLEVKP